MKRLFLVIFSALFLFGAASVLLNSNQAPLVLEAKKEVAPSQEELVAGPPAPKTLSADEFRVLSAEVMRTLPQRGFRQVASGGIHLPLVFAEERLLPVAEAVRNEPALEDDALSFYRECANSGQLPDTVKALCFLYMRSLVRASGKQMPRPAVSYEIRALADKLLN